MNATNTAPADPSAEQNRRYNFIAERALHLRIVEEFLAQIEFTLLKSSSDTFDFEQIKSGLRELKSLGYDAVERRKGSSSNFRTSYCYGKRILQDATRTSKPITFVGIATD